MSDPKIKLPDGRPVQSGLRANKPAPTLKEESVVLEGDCAELGEMIAEAAFPSIPSGPVRITISPLKENKTDDK